MTWYGMSVGLFSLLLLLGPSGSAAESCDSLPDDPHELNFPQSGQDKWKWNSIPSMKCMDKSSTGVWTRAPFVDPGSVKLHIHFGGGGACINFGTCSTCSKDPFCRDGFMSPNDDSIPRDQTEHSGPTEGLFKDTPENFFGDHYFVFIPYCSGDVHLGLKGKVEVAGEDRWFCGARNFEILLKHLDVTFPDVTELVVSGSSAGGFGAASHYDRTRTVFPNVERATLINDSGNILTVGGLKPCLQDFFFTTYGIDVMNGCCNPTENGIGMIELYDKLEEKYPNDKMMWLAAERDATMTLFFAHGGFNNDCRMLAPLAVPSTITYNPVYTASTNDAMILWSKPKRVGWLRKLEVRHTFLLSDDRFYDWTGTQMDNGETVTINQLINNVIGHPCEKDEYGSGGDDCHRCPEGARNGNSKGTGSLEERCTCERANTVMKNQRCVCKRGYYGSGGNNNCHRCPVGARNGQFDGTGGLHQRCICDRANTVMKGIFCVCKRGYYGYGGNTDCHRCPAGASNNDEGTGSLIGRCQCQRANTVMNVNRCVCKAGHYGYGDRGDCTSCGRVHHKCVARALTYPLGNGQAKNRCRCASGRGYRDCTRTACT